MRHSKTWFGALTATATALALAPFSCADVDDTTTGDCANAVDGVCPSAGAAGLGGSGGASGVGGAGSGGAPMMGQGGGGMGGTGGAPPCTDDETGDGACVTAKGEGSLCVGGTCTKATGQCDAKLLVVVAQGRKSDDAALADGCYFRVLDEARVAIGPTTARLAVYADSASSTATLEFTKSASLEGYHSDASKPVAITLPQAAITPLVRFAEGGALRGVTLGGGVATAVRHEAGTLAIAGPTTLANAAIALELVGAATATVTGTAEQKVLVTQNARGVYVGGTASLEVTGAGGESVVIEGTQKGAGVLVDKGQLDKGKLTMTGVLVRGNQGSDSSNGSGGVEVRGGRKATLSTNTFSSNNTSVNFQGQGISATLSTNTFSSNNTSVNFQGSTGDLFDAFKDVALEDNDFSGALPPGGTGVVICGRSLAANGTTLTIRGSNNQFPTSTTCQQLASATQPGSCDLGTELGLTGELNQFAVTCAP